MPTINNASPISVNPNLPSWRGAMPSLPQQEILMETKMPTPSLWGNIIDLAQAHTYGQRLNEQFNPSDSGVYSPLQKALYMDPYTSAVSEPKIISDNIKPQPVSSFSSAPDRANYALASDYEIALQNWTKGKQAYDDAIAAWRTYSPPIANTTSISPKVSPVKYTYTPPPSPNQVGGGKSPIINQFKNIENIAKWSW